MKLGFTFSIKYCENLGLEWRESLEWILSLGAWEYVRLPVYWDRVESIEGEYDFSEIDELLEMIEGYGLSIVPIVGYQNARWPERHGPEWVKNMSQKEFEEVLLGWIEVCVSHLHTYESIVVWQVENEPYENDWGDEGFDVRHLYTKEISLVRQCDLQDRPCMVTYGYKPWRKTFHSQVLEEDISGLDVYFRAAFRRKGVRVVLSQFLLPFARWRFVRDVCYVRMQNTEAWVTELQAEPWDCIDGALYQKSLWSQTISPEQMRRSLRWVDQAGVDVVFLWGVEWWLTLLENDREAFTQVLNRM